MKTDVTEEPATGEFKAPSGRSPRLRWITVAVAILLLGSIAVVALTRPFGGGIPTGSGTPGSMPDNPGAAGPLGLTPGTPTGSGPAAGGSAIGPDPSGRANADGDYDPIPQTDPEALIRTLSTAWNLTFEQRPDPLGINRSAYRLDKTTTRAIQVALIIDRDKRLLAASCVVAATKGEPLGATGRQFLLECGSGVAGPAGTTIGDWLGRAIDGRAPAASPTDRREVKGSVSGLSVRLSYTSQDVFVSINVPRP